MLVALLHQPRAICAEAGAGAATGALRDGYAGRLGTDEARDPDIGASSLRDASAKRRVDTAEKGRAAGSGRRGTGGRRVGGLRQTVSCRNK